MYTFGHWSAITESIIIINNALESIPLLITLHRGLNTISKLI